MSLLTPQYKCLKFYCGAVIILAVYINKQKKKPVQKRRDKTNTASDKCAHSAKQKGRKKEDQDKRRIKTKNALCNADGKLTKQGR